MDKVRVFNRSYFIGKNNFDDDGSQNYLVLSRRHVLVLKQNAILSKIVSVLFQKLVSVLKELVFLYLKFC